MKKGLLLMTLLVLSAISIFAIVSGSEAPETLLDSGFLRSYLFSEYVVYELRSPSSAGYTLKILRREFVDDIKSGFFKRPSFSIPEGPNFLMGIFNDILLVDTGTAPEPRTVSIYDLNTEQLIHRDLYFSPVEIVDGHLSYFSLLENPFRAGEERDFPGLLPEELYEKIEEMLEVHPYLGVAVAERLLFNFETEQIVRTGEFSIYYVQ